MIRFLLALVFTATPALAEPPRSVADIAPVHALLAQVMEGVGAPALLLTQEADPHAVQLRPSQARMLEQADLVVWVGPELSPWLEKALASFGNGAGLALTEHPATALRPSSADEGEHGDYDDDAGHDDHGEHDAHDHGDIDPHVWLSPDNARAWLGVFAETLAAEDPDNAATYRANAVAAISRIDALDAEIMARLAPHRGAEIVTFHAAFGYFTDHFGPNVAGSLRPSDASSPSAAAVAHLRDLVSTHGVRCAFTEPGFDPAPLQALAQDSGLRIGQLDAAGALIAPGPDHYAQTLRAIADGLLACLEAEPG